MANHPHVGDIGVKFEFTIKDDEGIVDISAADIQFILKKPSGTISTLVGTLTNAGTDGLCQYITVDGDLNEQGLYKLQGKITIGSDLFNTNIYQFKVEANIV